MNAPLPKVIGGNVQAAANFTICLCKLPMLDNAAAAGHKVQGQTKKKLVTVVWSKRKSCCRIMLHCPVCRPERVSTWWNLDEDRNIDETRWTGPNCSEIRSNPSAVTDGYLTATEPLPLTSVAKRQLAHKSIFRLFILSKSWRASTWFTCVGHCKKLLQLELSAKNKLG